MSYNSEQRKFISSFSGVIIENNAREIEQNDCVDEALQAYELWETTEQGTDS